MGKDILDSTILLSMTGIQYDKKFLNRYSCVICSWCGNILLGNKNDYGKTRLGICVSCYPNYLKIRMKEIKKKLKKMYHKNHHSIHTKYKQRKNKNKKLVFEHYCNGIIKCNCCGEPDKRFLTIDHIKNNGSEHRKKVNDVYSWLVKNNFPSGFQILCFNCNCAKGIYGDCPHILETNEYKIIDDDMFIMRKKLEMKK